MIARLSRFQVRLDKLDEVKKIIDSSVIPAAKKQQGFQSGYLLIDRKTGNCLTLGFWDTAKNALADERSGHFQQRAAMSQEFYSVPPVREIYEVSSEY
jgi:hypothetical protein